MIFELFCVYSIKITNRQLHAWILAQTLTVLVDEPPVKAVPDSAPISFFVIAHPQDITG